jgi:hypothetical protein
MNTALNTTGLGAAINPVTLAEPIDFYVVAGQLYYRHAGTGRVFRLRLDLAAIDRINAMDDDQLDKLTAGDLHATARIEEGPPDVIAHAGAVPLADWQLDAYMGSEWAATASEDLGDIVRDLADEADEHVLAHPLAEPAPFAAVEPVLGSTADIILATLAQVGPSTETELAGILAARGVLVLRGLAGHLEQLLADDLVQTLASTKLWTVSDAGKARAAKVHASLVALAGG